MCRVLYVLTSILVGVAVVLSLLHWGNPGRSAHWLLTIAGGCLLWARWLRGQFG
jgi:hypothetical protein